MNHCTEEQLLALLDGESSQAQRVRVEKHIAECWQCRAALQTLEEDIATVVRKFRAVEALPPPDRAALDRILSACIAAEPAAPRFQTAWWRFGAVAAACLILIAIALRAPLPAPQAPREIALAAERLEESPANGARLASQTLNIAIEETRPLRRSTQLRLRVWTDLTRRRSAVHWEGRIVPASYRPPLPMADAVTSSESAEEGLVRWFESRAPQRVSLARTLIEYADAHGLRIEIRGSWLIAERVDGRRRVALRLQLDVSGRPVVSAVRLDSDERSWEMTIRPEPLAYSHAAPLDELFTVRSGVARAIKPFTVPQPSAVVEQPPPDLDAAELEARYALHRAGVEHGQFHFAPTGRVLTVRAAPASAADREAWSHALAGRAHLRLDFDPQTTNAAAEEVVVPSPSQEAPPLDQLLKEYFLLQPGDAAERGRRMAAWLNDAVELSHESMRAAWALQRLAARYGPTDLRRFRTEQSWLLEVMLRDHLTDLDRALTRQQSLLEPLLGEAVAGAPAVIPDDWNAICETLFADVSGTQETLMTLLTGGSPLSGGLDEAVLRIRTAMGRWPMLRTEAENRMTHQFGKIREKP